jgi:hypothetical protein
MYWEPYATTSPGISIAGNRDEMLWSTAEVISPSPTQIAGVDPGNR